MPDSNQNPTLYILCGLPGSGKTTLAKVLEAQHDALRLTPDEWMQALGIDLFDEEARARIEALQWEVAERALTLGVNVVQDWGLWSRSERDHYRQRAATLGARTEIRFLDAPTDVLWSRLEARNDTRGEPFKKHHFLEWVTLFEAPTQEEMKS